MSCRNRRIKPGRQEIAFLCVICGPGQIGRLFFFRQPEQIAAADFAECAATAILFRKFYLPGPLKKMRSFHELATTVENHPHRLETFRQTIPPHPTLRHPRCFKPVGVKLGAPADGSARSGSFAAFT
jgi:hypothetical protein